MLPPNLITVILDLYIEKYINQQLCNKALRAAIDRQEIAMKNLKTPLQKEIEITKKKFRTQCSQVKQKQIK